MYDTDWDINSEDNFIHSPSDEPHIPNQKQSDGSSWGTIIWIFIILLGGYYLFFDSKEPTTYNANKTTYSSPSPIAKYSPSYSPTYNVPNYNTTTYSPPQYFGGYECTDDCSGHEAGYAWAEDKNIDNFDDCGGNSASFIEGCQSYVEETYPENVDENY